MPLVDGAAAAATMQSWHTCNPGLCLHYTWEAYAAHGATSAQSYPTALSAWEASEQQHPGDWDPPLGVPVYLGARSDSSAGDVFISLGGGRGVGTDWPGWGTIGEFTIQQRINQTGRPYLGWAGDILGNPIAQANNTNIEQEDPDMPIQVQRPSDGLIAMIWPEGFAHMPTSEVALLNRQVWSINDELHVMGSDSDFYAVTDSMGIPRDKIAAGMFWSTERDNAAKLQTILDSLDENT